MSYKLLGPEPTEAMVKSGIRAKDGYFVDPNKLLSSVAVIYRAMWNAAPAVEAEPCSRCAELEARAEHLKLEAQIHAQEARTANATIAEIYQAIRGASGEPGNWNGAKPVREYIAQQAERIRVLEEEDSRVHKLKDATITQQAEEIALLKQDAERWATVLQLVSVHDGQYQIQTDGKMPTYMSELEPFFIEAIDAAIKENKEEQS